jgi:hypothetical protein
VNVKAKYNIKCNQTKSYLYKMSLFHFNLNKEDVFL